MSELADKEHDVETIADLVYEAALVYATKTFGPL